MEAQTLLVMGGFGSIAGGDFGAGLGDDSASPRSFQPPLPLLPMPGSMASMAAPVQAAAYVPEEPPPAPQPVSVLVPAPHPDRQPPYPPQPAAAAQPAAAHRKQNPLPQKTQAMKRRSKYRGVTWHRQSSRWHARIFNEGTPHHIGLYSDEEEAARAYDAKAISLKGTSTSLNFPGDVDYTAGGAGSEAQRPTLVTAPNPPPAVDMDGMPHPPPPVPPPMAPAAAAPAAAPAPPGGLAPLVLAPLVPTALAPAGGGLGLGLGLGFGAFGGVAWCHGASPVPLAPALPALLGAAGLLVSNSPRLQAAIPQLSQMNAPHLLSTALMASLPYQPSIQRTASSGSSGSSKYAVGEIPAFVPKPVVPLVPVPPPLL